METAESIRHFWFGKHADDAATAQAQRSLWWGKDPAIDADMRARFGALLEQAASGALDAWAGQPASMLALILLCDQFPRNIHRGTPQAFAWDARALALATRAVESGMDRRLRPIERVFVYLPFEHAEDGAAQDQAVALFERLFQEVPPAQADLFRGYLMFALRHRRVIERFGRFPHRNTILGRASTPEELAFLQEPGSSF